MPACGTDHPLLTAGCQWPHAIFCGSSSLVGRRRSALGDCFADGGHDGDGSWVVSRDELLRRFAALPGTFPHTKRYAAEVTAGTGHDRFDFTIGLMIDGLARR